MLVYLPSLFAFFKLADVWPVALPCVLGVAAIFLLLPKPQAARTDLWGALLGGLALLLTAILIGRTGVLSPETVLFYTFAGLAIVSGTLLVTQHNPARAALSFALVVLSTCGLFLLLAAPFLMAATIIIYAGAIIVTFLFVLMLASQAGITDADARTREPLLATALGFLLLGCLIYVLQMSYENNETIRIVDEFIKETEQERASLTKDTLDREKFAKFPNSVVAQLEKAIAENENATPRPAAHIDELKHVKEAVTELYNSSDDWPMQQTADVDQMKEAYTRLAGVLVRGRAEIRNQHGWLPPIVAAGTTSNLSGPSAVEPTAAWRYDANHRPHLPADNSAFLGRSLFTDFLLPVELGGILLLVAVVGAIAIAHRRTHSQQTNGGTR